MAHAAEHLGAVSGNNAKDLDPGPDSGVEDDSAACRDMFAAMPPPSASPPSILDPDKEPLHDF